MSGSRRAPAADGTSLRARTAPPYCRSDTSMLLTVTLCLLALGAVMVTAPTAPSLLVGSGGSGTGELVRLAVWSAAALP